MHIKTTEGNYNVASSGVGNTALGLGIAGTALGLLNGNGGGFLGNLFGGNSNNTVSRETFDLSMQLAKSQQDNAILTAELNTEKKMVEVFNALNDKINKVVSDQTAINAAQAVTNCGFTSAIAVAQNNIMQLMGLTKIVVPGANICPQVTTTTTQTS